MYVDLEQSKPHIEIQDSVLKHRVADHFALITNRTLICLLLMVLLLFFLYRFGFQLPILGLWAFIIVGGISISVFANLVFRNYGRTSNEMHWMNVIHLLSFINALPWMLLPWLFLNDLRSEVLLIAFVTILLISTGVFFVPSNFFASASSIGLIFTSFCLRCLYPANELGLYAAILGATACAIMLISLRGLHLNYLHQIETTLLNRALSEETKLANDTKLAFLSTASHDLRQPVYSLSILLDAFSSQYQNYDKKLMRLMTASLGSMQSMLSSLLDFSKLEAGVMQPVLSSVNINDLVSELETEFAVQLRSSDNCLLNKTEDIIIQTDRAMLGSILRNLFSNAIQHCVNSNIEIKSTLVGKALYLSVCDQGPGIPDQYREQIFKVFFQLKPSDKKNEHGIGLGLSIVQRLCVLLGYLILANSGEKGTCFTVQIPFSSPKAM